MSHLHRSSPAEAWDDDRLAAAFAARWDRPAPRDLLLSTLERVGETRRRPRWWPEVDRAARGRLVASIAVAAAVLVVAFAVVPRPPSTPAGTARASVGSGASSSSSGGETPSPSVEPSPAVKGFAALVGELPVRPISDVPTLLTETGLGDTELVFAGWYSASDLALPCPYQDPPTSPIEIRCGDVRAGLASTAAPIFTADGTAIADRQDPAQVLPLRFVPPVDPLPGTSGPRSAMATTPEPIILIGHFHDERAAGCPADERATCEQTFVVDGIANKYGTLAAPYEASRPPTEGTRLTAAQAAKIARDRMWGDRASGGYGTILSVGLEHGNDAPSFTLQQKADCLCPPTWFVRGYRVLLDGSTDPRAPGTPVAGWLTVDDATGAVAGTLLTDVPVPATPFPYASAPAGFPETVGGLPVRTVADAVDPDRPPDEPGAPIAVAGWLSRLPPQLCPSGTNSCASEAVVLVGNDQRLVTHDNTGGVTFAPTVALSPAILPGAGELPEAGDGTPRRAVLIVHAGDPRADRQGPGDPVSRNTFVLDQVAWLDDELQGPSIWVAPGVVPTRSAPRILAEALDGKFMNPRTWVTSMAAVRRRDLAALGVASDAVDPPEDPNVIMWVVRMVGEPPAIGSFGLVDGYGYAVMDDATLSIDQGHWTSP